MSAKRYFCTNPSAWFKYDKSILQQSPQYTQPCCLDPMIFTESSIEISVSGQLLEKSGYPYQVAPSNHPHSHSATPACQDLGYPLLPSPFVNKGKWMTILCCAIKWNINVIYNIDNKDNKSHLKKRLFQKLNKMCFRIYSYNFYRYIIL